MTEYNLVMFQFDLHNHSKNKNYNKSTDKYITKYGTKKTT